MHANRRLAVTRPFPARRRVSTRRGLACRRLALIARVPMCAAECEGGREGMRGRGKGRGRETVARGGRKRSVETGVYMIIMNGEGQQFDYNERSAAGYTPWPGNARTMRCAASAHSYSILSVTRGWFFLCYTMHKIKHATSIKASWSPDLASAEGHDHPRPSRPGR
jgi:hypothetical protein